MAILDAFYILFESKGADKVRKDQESLSRSSGGLNQNLKKADLSTNQLSASFFNLGKKLALSVASIGSAGAVIAALKNSINYATSIEQTSRALQVNVSELDAWGTAVKRIGGTAEGFQSSLKNLSRNLYTSGDNALKILPQLADSFQKMSRVSALRYGATLGLDESTVQLLRKGGKELQVLIDHQKELGVVSKEDAVIARDYNFAWQDAMQSFRIAFLRAAGAILPGITKMLNKFSGFAIFLEKHSNLIVGGLLAIAAAAIAVAIPFVIANAAIIAIGLAVAGFIGVLALAYDDIKSFVAGNKSVTGELVYAWFAVGTSVENMFYKMFDVIKAIFAKMKAIFTGFFDEVGAGFSKITGAYDKVKGIFSKGDKIDAKLLTTAKQSLSLVSSSPLASTSSSAINNSFLQNTSADKDVTLNIGDVTIETDATDPQGIAEGFAKGLKEHFRQTINTFDDGVTI